MASGERKNLLERGRAACSLLGYLGGAWPLLSWLRFFPTWLLDPLYNFVARVFFKKAKATLVISAWGLQICCFGRMWFSPHENGAQAAKCSFT